MYALYFFLPRTRLDGHLAETKRVYELRFSVWHRHSNNEVKCTKEVLEGWSEKLRSDEDVSTVRLRCDVAVGH